MKVKIQSINFNTTLGRYFLRVSSVSSQGVLSCTPKQMRHILIKALIIGHDEMVTQISLLKLIGAEIEGVSFHKEGDSFTRTDGSEGVYTKNGFHWNPLEADISISANVLQSILNAEAYASAMKGFESIISAAKAAVEPAVKPEE